MFGFLAGMWTCLVVVYWFSYEMFGFLGGMYGFVAVVHWVPVEMFGFLCMVYWVFCQDVWASR